MRPTLFELSLAGRNLALPSYGVLVTAGFAAGVWLAARQARRQGLDAGAVLDVCFWALVVGLAGSRLLFVAQHAGTFVRLCHAGDCTAALRLWDGGLVFYGGALAAGALVAIMARRRDWAFGQIGDLLAPSLALGHVLGRLGCFAAGCCYGKPCAWGVAFPPGSVAYTQLMAEGAISSAAALTPPLHPTQLYEAAGELLIFVGLLLWRRRQRFTGELVLLYALAYALLRGLVELFRGDSARGFVGGVSIAQVASALIGALALALLVRGRRLERLRQE
jgi:phosphatidylglycerol:prolipoprotein diacylglycerol transferase